MDYTRTDRLHKLETRAWGAARSRAFAAAAVHCSPYLLDDVEGCRGRDTGPSLCCCARGWTGVGGVWEETATRQSSVPRITLFFSTRAVFRALYDCYRDILSDQGIDGREEVEI